MICEVFVAYSYIHSWEISAGPGFQGGRDGGTHSTWLPWGSSKLQLVNAECVEGYPIQSGTETPHLRSCCSCDAQCCKSHVWSEGVFHQDTPQNSLWVPLYILNQSLAQAHHRGSSQVEHSEYPHQRSTPFHKLQHLCACFVAQMHSHQRCRYCISPRLQHGGGPDLLCKPLLLLIIKLQRDMQKVK